MEMARTGTLMIRYADDFILLCPQRGQTITLEGRLGDHHAGEWRQESAAARGERIIREELGRLGWAADELGQRRKHDPDKLEMAARLRREPTLHGGLNRATAEPGDAQERQHALAGTETPGSSQATRAVAFQGYSLTPPMVCAEMGMVAVATWPPDVEVLTVTLRG